MITGYNTDVRHQDVVFHVQTEDKGESNPFIESLVYVGGQVLAAKRASYAKVLAEGKGEQAIVELMDHQHRTMIAAIRHGKFDSKVERVLGVQVASPTTETAADPAAVKDTAPNPALDNGNQTDFLAATRVTESERSLDQVILDYLTNEAEQEQLVLLLERGGEFAVGETIQLDLRTTSSKTGDAVTGSEVMVKMISTVAEARTLAFGETADDGRVQLVFEIPNLGSGTAALIISAESDIGGAELKYLL